MFRGENLSKPTYAVFVELERKAQLHTLTIDIYLSV